MLSVIVAAVAGAVGGLIAVGFAAPRVVVLLMGVAFFMLAVALMAVWGRRAFRGLSPGLEARFPTPRS